MLHSNFTNIRFSVERETTLFKTNCNVYFPKGFPDGASGKESACQCRRPERCGFDPWIAKIPWRRKWQPTPEFLPGQFHGQRCLVGYSPKSQTWLIICAQVHTFPSKFFVLQLDHQSLFYSLISLKFVINPYFKKLYILSQHATAKSLQSCPTLYDPIDGSPPGSTIPEILQARTLGWVAISFSNAWKWKVKVKLLVSDSSRPHRLQPNRLLHPWDFPGKSTGVECHCLLRVSQHRCQFTKYLPQCLLYC